MQKLFQLSLIVRSLLHRKQAISPYPKKIAVIQIAQLGDMIVTTPLFRAIKNNFPKAEITVIGKGINREILAGNPHIRNYLHRSDIFFIWCKQLQEFDLVIVCTFDLWGLAGAILTNTPCIAPTLDPSRDSAPAFTRTYRFLAQKVHTVRYTTTSYLPACYVSLLRAINIWEKNTDKELYYSQKAEEKILKFIGPEARKKIGILVSAGNKIKEWPEDRFVEVIQKIHNEYPVQFYLITDASNWGKAGYIQSKVGAGIAAINTAGMWNLDELKAFVAHMDCIIGVDTGPIYIAEAFKVPTIDILGPVDAETHPPRGAIHKNVYWKDREAPAMFALKSRNYNREEALKQIDMITSDDVLAAFRELFQ